ncbi:MAG: GspE/PulE/PilB domain-containing protein [Planctomycetota bacterium]
MISSSNPNPAKNQDDFHKEPDKKLPDGFKPWFKNARLRIIPVEGELPQSGRDKISRKTDAAIQSPDQLDVGPDMKTGQSGRQTRFRETGTGSILEPKQQIGQILLKYRLITQEQLDEALSFQAASKKHKLLGEILIELGFLTEMQLISTIAKICQIPFIQLEKYNINKAALTEIPFSDARRLELIPLDRLGKMLQIAMANPFDYSAVREIEESTGFTVKRVICTRSALNDAYSTLAQEWENMMLSRLGPQSLENVDDTRHGEEARAEAEADSPVSEPSSIALPAPSDTQEFPAVDVEGEKDTDQVSLSGSVPDIFEEQELVELIPKSRETGESTVETPEKTETDEEIVSLIEKSSGAADDTDFEIPAAEPEKTAHKETEAAPAPETPAVDEEAVPALDVDPEDEEFVYAEAIQSAQVEEDSKPRINIGLPEPDDSEPHAPPEIAPEPEIPIEIDAEEIDEPVPLSPEEALAMLMAPTEDEKETVPPKVAPVKRRREKPAPVKTKTPAPAHKVRPLPAESISPEQWKIIVPKSANQEFQERITVNIRRRVMPAAPVSEFEFETVAEIL